MPFSSSVPSRPTSIRRTSRVFLCVCVCVHVCSKRIHVWMCACMWACVRRQVFVCRKLVLGLIAFNKNMFNEGHIHHVVKQVPRSACQPKIKSGKWFLDAALCLPSQRKPRRRPWTINQALITTPLLPPTFPTPSQSNNSYCHSRTATVPVTASLFFSPQMWR